MEYVKWSIQIIDINCCESSQIATSAVAAIGCSESQIVADWKALISICSVRLMLSYTQQPYAAISVGHSSFNRPYSLRCTHAPVVRQLHRRTGIATVSKHVFQQQQSPAVKKKTRRKISEENAFKKSFGNFTCACVLLLCACVSVCKRWPHFHWLASWLAARTRLSCPAKATTAWRRPHASERSQWFACSTFTPNAWFLFCVFFLWFLNDRAWRPVCVRVSMWMMNDDDEIELKAPR